MFSANQINWQMLLQNYWKFQIFTHPLIKGLCCKMWKKMCRANSEKYAPRSPFPPHCCVGRISKLWDSHDSMVHSCILMPSDACSLHKGLACYLSCHSFVWCFLSEMNAVKFDRSWFFRGWLCETSSAVCAIRISMLRGYQNVTVHMQCSVVAIRERMLTCAMHY